VVVAYYGLAQLSGLLIPLVVAAVIGMIFHPVVDRLQQLGIPRAPGAGLVLFGLAAIAGASIFLAIKGVIDQGDLIVVQLENGWAVVQSWLADQGVSLEGLNNLWQSVSAGGGGAGGLVQAGFSGVAAFLLGLFVGTFLLFYLLKDWAIIRDWVAQHVGLPADLGSGLIDDATDSIRRYFYGLAVTSIPVAILIGLAMVVLGIPLAFTVALVTFVTSFIPYLGAIISGAFAVLVALGSGGLTDGIIMLVVVLVTQNVVQTLLLTKVTSDKLSLHPIVNLGSTLVGATVAGLVGATLSAPLVATVLAARKRVVDYYSRSEGPDGGDSQSSR
jgi:predicted PurR-regulated permease PerM